MTHVLTCPSTTRTCATAEFVRDRMANYVRDSIKVRQEKGVLKFGTQATEAGYSDTRMALFNAFLAIDEDMQHPALMPRSAVLTQGATAAFVYVGKTILDGSRFLYVANVGDVEAVLGRGGNHEVLSTMHSLKKPEGRDEATDLGGTISKKNGEYLLNVSGRFVRAFGEACHKPFGGKGGCTAKPSIKSVEITDDCDFVIIASEGFYQFVSHIDAVNKGELLLSPHCGGENADVLVLSPPHSLRGGTRRLIQGQRRATAARHVRQRVPQEGPAPPRCLHHGALPQARLSAGTSSPRRRQKAARVVVRGGERL